MKYNIEKEDEIKITHQSINYTKIPPTKSCAQRGARTHDPEIKSLMLYRLS